MSTSNGINIGDTVTLDQNTLIALTTGVEFKVVGLGGNDRISIAVTLPNGVSGRLDFVPVSGVSPVQKPVNVGDELTSASPEPPVGTVLIDRSDKEILVRYGNEWKSTMSSGNTWTSVTVSGHTYEVIAV